VRKPCALVHRMRWIRLKRYADTIMTRYNINNNIVIRSVRIVIKSSIDTYACLTMARTCVRMYGIQSRMLKIYVFPTGYGLQYYLDTDSAQRDIPATRTRKTKYV
jgi:hypothetical protein